MTESDWLNCQSPERLLSLTPLQLDERRWRLLACGVCRQFARCDGDESLQAALAAAEAFADDEITGKQLATVQRRAQRLAVALTQTALGIMEAWRQCHDQATREQLADQGAEACRHAATARLLAACADLTPDAVFHGFGQTGPEGLLLEGFRGQLVEDHPAVVHDILGNPFRRHVIDSLWLTWRDGFIPGLAGAIYTDQRFEDMPILGDALEDAGCADRGILDHCHGSGPHARGCWLLDSILGRTAPPRAVASEPLLKVWPEKYSTPLDPVIGTGVAQGGATWVSLRLESSRQAEPVRFVSEVDPADLDAEVQPLLGWILTTVQDTLRAVLATFAPRNRPLAGASLTLLRAVIAPATRSEETLASATRDALERALHEAVLVPLEVRL